MKSTPDCSSSGSWDSHLRGTRLKPSAFLEIQFLFKVTKNTKKTKYKHVHKILDVIPK